MFQMTYFIFFCIIKEMKILYEHNTIVVNVLFSLDFVPHTGHIIIIIARRICLVRKKKRLNE